MKLSEIIDKLGLQPKTAGGMLGREVTSCYSSDLLSDVMGNARAGSLWITLQTHQNIVAVAVLKEIAGIVLVNGRKPEEDTVLKAEEEGVPLLLSPDPTFEIAGKLYALGLRARADAQGS